MFTKGQLGNASLQNYALKMLRRQNSRHEACKYKILLAGEQIRFQMHVQQVIADRRYHFRTYKTCFVGRDAVDWLLLNRHAHTREDAITCMQILQDEGVLHHVCDDHIFKDEYLFFRFRRDDDSYTQYKDLRAFFKGERLFDKLQTSRDVLRDFHPPGAIYRDAFIGRELIDWMLECRLAYTRENAIKDCRELLENDVIKHVTDDYHFRDADYIYQFTMDFHQPYLLSDILAFRRTSSTTTGRACSDPTHFRSRSKPVSVRHSNMRRSFTMEDSSPSSDSSRTSLPPLSLYVPSPSAERFTSASPTTDSPDTTQPKSVLLRHASVQELEDPDTPYIKQTVHLISDSVGFGFVIRGSIPTYVQTVDPSGPAAAAGIKVRQYIYSVNGQNVLRLDHKAVGKMIIQTIGVATLVVMTHKRDASG